MLQTLDLRSLPAQTRMELPTVVLEDLKRVVILAGPNGGGKTRMLRLLQGACAHAQAKAMKAANVVNVSHHAPSGFGATAFAQNITAVNCISLPPLVVPPINRNSGSHRTSFPTSDEITVQGEMGRLFGYLHGVARALFNLEHPALINDPEVIRDGQRARKIKNDLLQHLNIDLDYQIVDQSPTPSNHGSPLSLEALSPGELVLLSWFVAIEKHSQHPSPKALPIVMAIDEIENHLHPSAVVDVLSRLLGSLGGSGQIWLATHSPAVVASFAGEASVYAVSRHSIQYSSSNLTSVIDGLVGGEDGRRQLRNIFDEADRVAFFAFAAQCLQDALVADASHKVDPQFRQLASLLERRIQAGATLRVLDYSAGRGRFAAEIARRFSQEQRAQIDYFTYDDQRYDTDALRRSRREHLREMYPEGEGAEERMLHEISDVKHERRVDLVILCNVLHEIEPIAWLQTFGQIRDALKDDGFLLIMEDQEMAVGELPNPTGFIVLELAELRELFGSTDGVVPLPGTSGGRCSAVLITRDEIQKLLDKEQEGRRSRIRGALSALRDRMIAKVKVVRSKTTLSYREGREHARAVMMLSNVVLALDQM